jgi:hypothetical protein
VSKRDSSIVYSGFSSRLTCSVRERESIRRVKRMIPLCVQRTCVLQVASRCFESSRAVLAINVPVIRSSSISSGRRRVSLYRAAAYVVL